MNVVDVIAAMAAAVLVALAVAAAAHRLGSGEDRVDLRMKPVIMNESSEI